MEPLIAQLKVVQATAFSVYLKAHNFHWNVTGPMFNTLHQMFMTQYTEQWSALDLIAERIRALGFPAPGTYKEYTKLSSIQEVSSSSTRARHCWIAGITSSSSRVISSSP